MNAKQARAELAQYVQTTIYECPGYQWRGWIQRHYDESGRVTGRTWNPPYGQDIHRASCQTSGLPDERDYAAQVTWNRKMRRLLAAEPTWRTDTWPAPEYDPRPRYAGLPAEHGLGVRFVKALRATGPGWERDILKAWPRPGVKAKRARRVA